MTKLTESQTFFESTNLSTDLQKSAKTHFKENKKFV
jgi:hypothetical protein